MISCILLLSVYANVFFGRSASQCVDTENNCGCIIIPEKKLEKLTYLPQKFKEILQNYTESRNNKYKQVLTEQHGFDKDTIDKIGSTETLESFVFSHQMNLHRDVISKIEEAKYIVQKITEQNIAVHGEELQELRNLTKQLRIFLKNNLDSGHENFKQILLSHGMKKEEIAKIGPAQPLEGFILLYQMVFYPEIKSMFSEMLDSKEQNILKFLQEKLLDRRPSDCSDLLAAGKKKSGVYKIYPYSDPVEVFCDMDTDGGGWTVFLERSEQSHQLNFTRNWKDYKDGFGTPDAEYWLGNEVLHILTSNRKYIMRIEAQDEEKREVWGEYSTFVVDSESSKYKLTINSSDEESTINNRFSEYHNGIKFSTFDQDNDKLAVFHCSEEYKGGWWYNTCYRINPTGVYGDTTSRGVALNPWSKTDSTIRYARKFQMKIRPWM